MEFTISLAGLNICVESIYDEVYEFCRDYLTEAAPDLHVSVSPADIENERRKNLLEARIEGMIPVDYPDSYLETLAVYRKIVTLAPGYDTFLMHGAVIAVGGRAWLFTASSGTGKTTHINLWLDNIPGSYVVNGDKPLIRIANDITVYGTPWAGKEGMQQNVGVKLCGIVILGRGTENSIQKISFTQALPMLVQQTYRPNDKEGLTRVMQLIQKLGSRVPLYRLHCNMLPEAALTAYNMLDADTKEHNA